eukprot:2373049-Pleurochrysis_carterae.AAC.8
MAHTYARASTSEGPRQVLAVHHVWPLSGRSKARLAGNTGNPVCTQETPVCVIVTIVERLLQARLCRGTRCIQHLKPHASKTAIRLTGCSGLQ